MGTWGLGTFDDDIACDWLEDLHDSDPIAFFSQCLDLTGLDYLEFLACVGVVCTAEIVYGSLRPAREGVPEEVHAWLKTHQSLNLLPFVPDAIAGLRRVLGRDSEMRELWEDNEEMYEAWIRQIGDLLNRLEAAIAENEQCSG